MFGLACAWAQSTTLGPGSELAELPVGKTVYQQVVVRSITTRTLVFLHRGGLTSIKLRDLSPEWQQRFNYDPAAETTETATPPAPLPTALRRLPAPASKSSAFESVLQKFGQPAVIRAEVDLRPKFFQLELKVKDQGRRPSCAVFAVVSALEFQNAELTGRAEKFSEEYLSWAVRKTVQRLPAPPASPGAEAVSPDDTDAGFALAEVVAALRTYGIPLQASMPNTFGQNLAAIPDPPAGVIAEARAHQHVFVHSVPGRDHPTRLNNIIHALNAGLPVAVGMAWPHYRSLRNAYLDAQKPLPDGGHAVTLVGYRSSTGRLEEAVFIFKNSWGATWGQGGYGVATYRYLNAHLHDAVLLEIRSATEPGQAR